MASRFGFRISDFGPSDFDKAIIVRSASLANSA
jgi:hypothetical protein